MAWHGSGSGGGRGEEEKAGEERRFLLLLLLWLTREWESQCVTSGHTSRPLSSHWTHVFV